MESMCCVYANELQSPAMYFDKGCHSLHMASHWYLKVQIGKCASEM